MKALKGLLIYIGIVLAIIAGLGVIIFAVMYFVPSFRIGGVGVVHARGMDNAEAIDFADYSGYSDIEINLSSKKVSLIVVPSEENVSTIDYVFTKNFFGLAFDITEYKVIKNAEIKDGTLKISIIVTEPDGMISSSNSTMKVTLPYSKTYNLHLSSTSGNITIYRNNNTPAISNLTASTTTGMLNIRPTNSKTELTDISLTSLNLSTNSGKIDLTNIPTLNVVNTIKLEATNGTYSFKNVNGSFYVTGRGIKLDADTITTDNNGFKFISENGFFNIKKLNTPVSAENTIVTENCDVKIAEISGRTGIMTTYGSITIGLLNDYATLQSKHGNINITKSKGDIRAITEYGNITVNAYEKSGKFVSKRGDINVKSTGEYSQGVLTQIENTEGKIKVDNKVNKLLVTTYGSSNVDITFRVIKGEFDPKDTFKHIIKIHKDGNAVVYIPTVNYKTPFMFLAKGNISGEISGLVPEYEGDKVQSRDTYQYFPVASEGSKKKCENSCVFEFIGGTINFQGYQNI